MKARMMRMSDYCNRAFGSQSHAMDFVRRYDAPI